MSPDGTAENGVANLCVKRHSVVPSGLCNIAFVSIPSDESLGYFQMSPWDKRLRESMACANVPYPNPPSVECLPSRRQEMLLNCRSFSSRDPVALPFAHWFERQVHRADVVC